MDKSPRIVGVEWVPDGVVVSFANGKTARYPVALLHENIDRAEELLKLPDLNQREDGV
jgi:hypothetical protein